MIKFFSLKQEKKEQTETAASPDGSSPTAGTSPVAASTGTVKKKPKAAHLRVQKDLTELNLPKNIKIDFPSADDLLNFNLTIQPDEGLYKGGSFDFTFKIKDNYPHEPPKVRCTNKIFHPNIDLDGGVCLNILRDDWMPVLSIQSVIYGLQYLFLEPNADDPLNKEAAEVLRSNRRQFEDNVKRTMRGGYLNGVEYDNVLLR